MGTHYFRHPVTGHEMFLAIHFRRNLPYVAAGRCADDRCTGEACIALTGAHQAGDLNRIVWNCADFDAAKLALSAWGVREWTVPLPARREAIAY